VRWLLVAPVLVDLMVVAVVVAAVSIKIQISPLRL